MPAFILCPEMFRASMPIRAVARFGIVPIESRASPLAVTRPCRSAPRKTAHSLIPAALIRGTTDVDVIAGIMTYTEYIVFSERPRKKQFRKEIRDDPIACRCHHA
jgi:hypothetical protein